jgi:hypothetical protein
MSKMVEMTEEDQQDIDSQLLLAVRAIEHMAELAPKRKGEVTSTIPVQALEACQDAITKANDPVLAVRYLETAHGMLTLFNAPGRDAAFEELEQAIKLLKARIASPKPK